MRLRIHGLGEGLPASLGMHLISLLLLWVHLIFEILIFVFVQSLLNHFIVELHLDYAL